LQKTYVKNHHLKLFNSTILSGGVDQVCRAPG